MRKQRLGQHHSSCRQFTGSGGIIGSSSTCSVLCDSCFVYAVHVPVRVTAVCLAKVALITTALWKSFSYQQGACHQVYMACMPFGICRITCSWTSCVADHSLHGMSSCKGSCWQHASTACTWFVTLQLTLRLLTTRAPRLKSLRVLNVTRHMLAR